MSKKTSGFGLLLLILIGISFHACHSESETIDRVLLQNCGSCHIVPEPQSLTKDIWTQSILPLMSDYFVWGKDSSFDYANKPFYRKKGHMPMNDSLWALIESHYVNNSLQEIVPRLEETFTEQSFFEIKQFSELCKDPSITALKILPDNKFWSSSRDYILNTSLDGNTNHKIQNEFVPTQLNQLDDTTLFVLHSGQLRPHNQPFGSLVKINLVNNSKQELIDNLKRPVNLIQDDSSLLITEFGNTEGGLTKIEDNNYNSKTKLHSIPGCYKLFYFDIDNDGEKEYITQCTQALEGIYSINEQSDLNSTRKLIDFPPEYGLSDLDTTDINQDGLTDILIALGDNADYSNMAKSFHGIRIFVNKGNRRFEEAYRYDWYGTTQARFIHANNDSKIDIIASSYFPVSDNSPVRLLINTTADSGLSFDAFGISESTLGRWMTMDKADIDSDGDEDVIFGSFVNGPTTIDSAQTKIMLDNSVDVLLLKNLKNN